MSPLTLILAAFAGTACLCLIGLVINRPRPMARDLRCCSRLARRLKAQRRVECKPEITDDDRDLVARIRSAGGL